MLLDQLANPMRGDAAGVGDIVSPKRNPLVPTVQASIDKFIQMRN